MLRIVTHPDNVPAVERMFKQMEKPCSDLDNLMLYCYHYIQVDIVENHLMEPTRDKPGGKVYLPKDSFVEYEESDYEWLHFFGLASREQEIVVYVVDTSRLRATLEMPVLRPRITSLIASAAF